MCVCVCVCVCVCIINFLIFIVVVVVRLNSHELLDLLMLYIWSLRKTIFDSQRLMKSDWSEGGPRYKGGGYLTFSLASFLLLLLILSGDIELNPGPQSVKY